MAQRASQEFSLEGLGPVASDVVNAVSREPVPAAGSHFPRIVASPCTPIGLATSSERNPSRASRSNMA